MRRKRGWSLSIAGTCLLAMAVTPVLSVAVGSTPAGASEPNAVVYSAIPSTLAGNVSSDAFEATSTKEFGDLVGLTQTGYLNQARVVMSSWGCQSGAWFDATCATTPGATFT